MKYEWIGPFIRKRRIEQDFSIERLAFLSGVESQSIGTAERSEGTLGFQKIIDILNALNITFDECYGNYGKEIILKNEICHKLNNCSNDDYILMLNILKIITYNQKTESV